MKTYRVTFLSRASDWTRCVDVKATSREYAPQAAAQMLGFSGFRFEDREFGIGDLYRRTDNGMSFRTGSAATLCEVRIL